MKKRILGFLLIFVLSLSAYFFYATDIHSVFTLAYVRTQQMVLAGFIQLHPIVFTGSFMLLYALTTTIALPIAGLLSLVAGFVFGIFFGTIVVLVSATVGATLAFVLARYFLRDWFQNRMGVYSSRFETGLKDNAFSYILFLRLIPLFPFFAVNTALALTRISLRTYVFATLLGIIPGTLLYVLAGQRLAVIADGKSILTPLNTSVLILLGLLSLAPVLWKRRVKHTHTHNALLS